MPDRDPPGRSRFSLDRSERSDPADRGAGRRAAGAAGGADARVPVAGWSETEARSQGGIEPVEREDDRSPRRRDERQARERSRGDFASMDQARRSAKAPSFGDTGPVVPAGWNEPENDPVGERHAPDSEPPDRRQSTDQVRAGRGRAAPRPRATTRREPRPISKPRLPATVRGADLVGDQRALLLLGLGAFGLLVMAALTGNRVGDVSDGLAIHVDAYGRPDRWGTAGIVWRLPLLAGMVTLMNLIVAWVVSRRDRFASQFLLGSALVVQLIAWVALVSLLW